MRRLSTWIVPLFWSCWIAPSTGHASDEDFSAIVTKVFDGDSFVVRPLGAHGPDVHEIGVRLADIDAPEKDQPYADTARNALIKLIEGRRVFVDVIGIDRYQRKVSRVYREPDRLDIVRTLTRDGHVWVNRKFAKDRSLIELEDRARAVHTGVWSLQPGMQMPPWEFRRENGRDQRKPRVGKQAQKAQK